MRNFLFVATRVDWWWSEISQIYYQLSLERLFPSLPTSEERREGQQLPLEGALCPRDVNPWSLVWHSGVLPFTPERAESDLFGLLYSSHSHICWKQWNTFKGERLSRKIYLLFQQFLLSSVFGTSLAEEPTRAEEIPLKILELIFWKIYLQCVIWATNMVTRVFMEWKHRHLFLLLSLVLLVVLLYENSYNFNKAFSQLQSTPLQLLAHMWSSWNQQSCRKRSQALFFATQRDSITFLVWLLLSSAHNFPSWFETVILYH